MERATKLRELGDRQYHLQIAQNHERSCKIKIVEKINLITPLITLN